MWAVSLEDKRSTSPISGTLLTKNNIIYWIRSLARIKGLRIILK